MKRACNSKEKNENRYLKYLVAYISISLLFLSCQDDNKVQKHTIEAEDVSFEMYRIDQNICGSQRMNAIADLDKSFRSLFFSDILPLGGIEGEELNNVLDGFCQDSLIASIYNDVEATYGKDNILKKEMESAFGKLKAVIPDIQIPDLYFFISEFGYQLFLFSDENGHNAIGIGLDMFLKDYPYKRIAPDLPSFSDYLTRTYNKDHITAKIVKLILEDYLYELPKSTFLEQLITHGKELYVTDMVIENIADTVLHEYTPSQMKWCQENEQEIWSYLLDQDLFYSSELQKFNKYVNPSPTSPGMPEASPGRTANFIGSKIIAAYIRRNPHVSIKELLLNKNAQEILEQSRYKPKR